MKTGIIGYGERGTLLGELAAQVEKLELVAICDTSQDARDRACKQRLGVYDDPGTMIDTEDLEVVFIANGASNHAKAAITAAERGCHILLEKPIATSPEEAHRIANAIERNRVTCSVDFETMYSPPVGVLRDLLKENWFGDLLRIEATDKGRCPAYDVETCMPHFLHMVSFLLGGHAVPLSVHAVIRHQGEPATERVPIPELYPKGRGAHGVGLRADYIGAQYLFSDGPILNYHLPRLDHEFVEQATGGAKPGSRFMMLEFYGTRGRVRYFQTSGGSLQTCRTPAPMANTPDLWAPFEINMIPDPSWRNQTLALIEDFTRSICEGVEPLTSIQDAVQVTEMMYAIYQSHLSGKVITFPLEDRGNPLVR